MFGVGKDKEGKDKEDIEKDGSNREQQPDQKP